MVSSPGSADDTLRWNLIYHGLRWMLGTTFVGSSAVLAMSADPSRIEMIEAFGRKEEGVMFARVN